MRAQPAAHYPEVDRPVVAMAKEFATGSRTGWHCHARAQLIFAIEGLMVATTDDGTWVVPPSYALWVPPGVMHDVAMHGLVSMRTVYVRADSAALLPSACRVVSVSPLLEAALVALSAEPAAYDEAGRAGHVAALISDEIARAPATAFALLIPADRRLAKIAQHLIKHPDCSRDIDDWAEEVGVSRRTLTRLFRKHTGISLGAWRRRLRLLQAAARCADGAPLARTAASVGYRSIAAFRAMSRRELGTHFDRFPLTEVVPKRRGH